jgi:protein SCO1/2
MKRVLAVLAVAVAVVACSEAEKPKPLSVAGEKVYEVRGRIVARDAADNTVRLDHEAIRGFMEAMTMDYSVRGAKVVELPADNTRVAATLHVTDDGYWLTNVKRIP